MLRVVSSNCIDRDCCNPLCELVFQIRILYHIPNTQYCIYLSCILNLPWIAKDSTSPQDFNTNILVALLANYCATVIRQDIVLGIILYVFGQFIKINHLYTCTSCVQSMLQLDVTSCI